MQDAETTIVIGQQGENYQLTVTGTNNGSWASSTSLRPAARPIQCSCSYDESRKKPQTFEAVEQDMKTSVTPDCFLAGGSSKAYTIRSFASGPILLDFGPVTD